MTTYDTVFAWAGGRTARLDALKAMIPLILAAAFYTFIAKSGRNGEWVLATLLYPGFVLVARRLHDMGWSAWLLVAPAVLDAVALWVHFFTPSAAYAAPAVYAATVISAAFLIWALIGPGQATTNRYGEPTT